MSRQRIRKAVFPVAGMGTRFLPATKAMPKELLPIVDKPLIQYAVEEAVAAGLTELIFITGRTKRAIEDHLDANTELEQALLTRGQTGLVEELRAIVPSGVSCIFIRQPEPLGLGHAVLCAEPVVRDEPFAVLLPDDLMLGDPLPTRELVDLHVETGDDAISVSEVPLEEVRKFGIIDPEGPVLRGKVRAAGIIEKPDPSRAPSQLAATGRYVFGPGLFAALHRARPGANGEIQLTDAIDDRAREGRVIALLNRGRRYDCGSKSGYLEAIVDQALSRPDLAPAFERVILQRAAILARKGDAND
jgi:UTP--glucose-1-phosphate uridylyltransferase